MKSLLFLCLSLLSISHSLICQKRTEICTADYNPVCAYFCDSKDKTKCTSKTYPNFCTSCSEEILPTRIVKGECLPDKVYCKNVDLKLIKCAANAYVCGYTKKKKKVIKKTYNNLCEACSDSVDYIINGSC